MLLASTFFLAGPKKQFQRMMQENRRLCCGIYVGNMLLVIILAFAWTHNTALKGPIMFLLIVTQACCVVWYIFTYIPGGQRMLKQCCRCLIRKADNALPR